jgi:hypothetical protein
MGSNPKKELNEAISSDRFGKPNMNLDESQRKKVAEWIKQGLKLAEIQNRLVSELGVKMTYMEVRLLVDDLKLVPKDVEPPRASGVLAAGPGPASGGAHRGASDSKTGTEKAQPATGAGGGVSVAVDQLARPGAVVSGKVTFSDGNRAEWYLDQAGRLGLVAQQPGYRPPAADVQKFQAALETELAKMGL